MDLQPHTEQPDLTQVTFASYREFVVIRWSSPQVFGNWLLRSLHLRPQIEFPHTEAISNERLGKDAIRLHQDAHAYFASGNKNAGRFHECLAQTIDYYLQPESCE